MGFGNSFKDSLYFSFTLWYNTSKIIKKGNDDVNKNQALKEIRRRTGENILKIKDAYELCQGDIDLAEEFLRIKIQPLVRKKEGKPYQIKDYIELAKENLLREKGR